MKIEYEIKWWKKWIKADLLKRLEMTKKLPFTNNIIQLCKSDLKEKHIKHSITTMLNGFFEDLENALYTQQLIEKEKEKNKK